MPRSWRASTAEKSIRQLACKRIHPPSRVRAKRARFEQMVTCDSSGDGGALAQSFVLIDDMRTWDEASTFCSTCLGGRLAVLDTCAKHEGAAAALSNAPAVGILARVASRVVGASSLPFASVFEPLIGDADALLLPPAHIGMRTVGNAFGDHSFRWFCPSEDGEGAEPCPHGEAGGVLSATVDQRSVHANGAGWGWNVVDRTLQAHPARRGSPQTAFLNRGMWDNEPDAEARRAFVCEFDELAALAGDEERDALCRAMLDA